jgi:hypothetical protein
MLLLHYEATRLVEPEVVATSPNRIKSPVPVCCGFDSRNDGKIKSMSMSDGTVLILNLNLNHNLTLNLGMVRASGNAPEPGTDLVRCGV